MWKILKKKLLQAYLDPPKIHAHDIAKKIMHVQWAKQSMLHREKIRMYTHQAPVVQRLDNTIHWIKCWQNKPRYPLDIDLSGG